MTKIKKVNELNEIHLESLFYFLNNVSMSSSPTVYFEFLKSLNLSDDQYSKLAEIMEDFGRERYSDGRQDGIECPLSLKLQSMQDPY